MASKAALSHSTPKANQRVSMDPETSESSFFCRLQCGDVVYSPWHHTVVK